MNSLRDLRERIPTGDRLYTLLAAAAIVIIILGYFLFIRFSILPHLQTRNELASQLNSAERDLLEAQTSPGNTSGGLVQQVETAQARLDAAAGAFLSESEAAQVLNSLYRYAGESGVEITDLQTQPGLGEEGKGIYDARTFQLQVKGAVPKLVDFVSRIKEASAKSLVMSNVNIAETEGASTLTMGVTLYTSPYASGAAGSATPGVTPVTPPTSLAQLEDALAIVWAARDWKQAIGLIGQILTIDPHYAGMAEKLYSARVNYGYQLLAEGNVGGATTQFNLALEIKPGGEEALAGIEQASATPPPILTPIEELAQRLHEPWTAENWPEVISLIEQILALDPNYDDMTEKLYAAHVNYGYRLAAEGQLEEAKAEFIRALDIKPDGAEALAGLRELAGETPVPPQPTTQPPSATPTPQSGYITYVVQQGDTLYSIARRYGTTVEAIKAANGLPDNNIHVGQQLRIPTGSSSTPIPQYTIYVVRAGDTLYSIARKFGTTVQAIVAANGLTGTNISVGQQLRIPTP